MDACADACLHANPLQFDEEKHEYRLRGKVLPSVTSIIKAILPPQYEFAGEWHMQRGAATHKACELADQGRLDWSSVDPEILPRVKAWMKFRRDFPAELVANEKRMAHAELGYAGTADRLLKTPEGELIVCDIKNSVMPQVVLQLAAYLTMFVYDGIRPIHRAVAVELLETGEYRCHWFDKQTMRQACMAWLNMVGLYNFASQHGLLKGKE